MTAARQIIQTPDARLRELSTPVTEFDPILEQLCRELERARLACREPRALGLAAPQIGELVRVGSLNPGTTVGHRFMVNPEIIRRGSNKSWGEEGCMSIEGGLRKFRVKRWDTITVRFQDVSGATHEVLARELAARVVQHEVDHLDGVMVDALARKLVAA